MFRNTMPRYEVLSQDAMATLDQGWRRLMTEVGVEFMDDRALELFRRAATSQHRCTEHTPLRPDGSSEASARRWVDRRSS